MSPLPHHLDPSLRGDTPWFPQLVSEWRTNQLGKMPALLRQPLKLPLLPCSGVQLTSPIAPPNQMEEEKQYVLVVTTSIRSLNLEMTSVILGDKVATSAGGGAFQNPRMAAVLSGVTRSQGVIMKELGKKNAE